MSKKRKVKEKHALFHAVKEAFQMPPTDMYTQSFLVINAKGHIQLENCKAVTYYDENTIEFNMGNVCVSVTGDKLVMHTLSKNLVSVSGTVFDVRFIYNK
ncbi:MAG: YabP/YqfC family sporulation protein [Oscillospiraceae bacterium]|nr:YabP/YqfC family sporulation protein [Oscillospiraceae bacterium]